MKPENLRTHYPTAGGSDLAWSRDVQLFLSIAGWTRFEMRFIGEDRWYPAPADDVASTLAPYYPDLEHCLDQMLTGEEVASRLALFRVARRGSRF